MQQQLDNLCEQVNYFKDQPGTWDDTMFAKNNDYLFNEQFASEKAISVARGCRLSDQHQPNDPTVRTYCLQFPRVGILANCQQREA